MEGSLSEAGTSPLHDSDTPHIPVARKTTTTYDDFKTDILHLLSSMQDTFEYIFGAC